MSNLAHIHVGTKVLHEKAHNLAYLARYSVGSATLLDHYRHLLQLLPLYEALERKLKDKEFAFALPEEFHELLTRSERIKADLDFLRPHIPQSMREQAILKATNQYAGLIDNLNAADASTEILSHFLVRILGDLFGGQQIKEYVKQVYEKEKIYSEKEPEQGLGFYHFDKDMLRKFSVWLNAQSLDKEKLVNHSNAAFTKLITIFEDLEKTRAWFSRSECCSRFFNLSKAKQVLLVGAAVVVPVVATIAACTR